METHTVVDTVLLRPIFKDYKIEQCSLQKKTRNPTFYSVKEQNECQAFKDFIRAL